MQLWEALGALGVEEIVKLLSFVQGKESREATIEFFDAEGVQLLMQRCTKADGPTMLINGKVRRMDGGGKGGDGTLVHLLSLPLISPPRRSPLQPKSVLGPKMASVGPDAASGPLDVGPVNPPPPFSSSSESAYMFDVRSGFFYHHESGFFYDPKTDLYYSSARATYFKMKEDGGLEEFKGVEVKEEESSVPKVRMKVSIKLGGKLGKGKKKVKEKEGGEKGGIEAAEEDRPKKKDMKNMKEWEKRTKELANDSLRSSVNVSGGGGRDKQNMGARSMTRTILARKSWGYTRGRNAPTPGPVRQQLSQQTYQHHPCIVASTYRRAGIGHSSECRSSKKLCRTGRGASQ